MIYAIRHEKDIQALVGAVNEDLKDGYELVGGVSVTTVVERHCFDRKDDDGHCVTVHYYHQTLIKKDAVCNEASKAVK